MKNVWFIEIITKQWFGSKKVGKEWREPSRTSPVVVHVHMCTCTTQNRNRRLFETKQTSGSKTRFDLLQEQMSGIY